MAETKLSVGVLLTGLGLCTAGCIVGAGGLQAVGAMGVAEVLRKAAEALAPNLAAEVYSRFPDWWAARPGSKGQGQNHDLQQLVVTAIRKVLKEAREATPRGAGRALLDKYLEKGWIEELVKRDRGFPVTWEKLRPCFKDTLEQLKDGGALDQTDWLRILNGSDAVPEDKDELAAMTVAAEALRRDLPRELVIAYRKAFAEQPTVYAAADGGTAGHPCGTRQWRR